ncbi:MAG: reverse transcriptase/maturase family protein, partial [Patescibacteria group bacterium]
MKIKFIHDFESITSVDNLLEAWGEFVRGKKRKKDVQEFYANLMDNVFLLHEDLRNHTYKHGKYQAFNICDPKPRNIHKASVRDRLLHHAIYRRLYPFFAQTFIADSFSCQLGKGSHRALDRFRLFAHKTSGNYTRTCWILKCDIKKFFANINHNVLIKILKEYISDREIIWLVEEIIGSFNSGRSGVGLPLGNLTSQLFVNVYMNEFDQFIKHKLKAEYYVRYADDFVILSTDKIWLEDIVLSIKKFLLEELKLELHPDKVFIKTLASGVDFLGWVHFSDHKVLRTTTRRRMIKRLAVQNNEPTINSYLGLLSHGN